MHNHLTQKAGIDFPLIQAPMAGVSTPELAAAVSNAGALGSLGLGASTVAQAETLIARTRALTPRPFGVNLFCHAPAVRDDAVEQNWIARWRPLFEKFGAQPPETLAEIYKSFHQNGEMLELLLAAAPAMVSFHFGLPDRAAIRQLHGKGILLAATATHLGEARAIQESGIDVVIAQGIEAGGHRGTFNERDVDYQLSTFTLVQQLKQHLQVPVVAAGGVMDGAGIGAMLSIGADGVQMGTAFLLCAETGTDEGYRAAIRASRTHQTWMTPAISGRRARCLDNDFCEAARALIHHAPPCYPVAYDLGKSLAGAAKARGHRGFGAHWAGQGINLIREMPAGELVAVLIEEYQAAARPGG